jgi:hypothetical protein
MRNSLAFAFGVWLLALGSAEALDQSAVNWSRIVGTCVGYVRLKGGRDFEAVPGARQVRSASTARLRRRRYSGAVCG